MRDVIDVEEIVKGTANFMELTGKYAMLIVTVGLRGPDWAKAFYALNIMSDQGWKLVEWVVVGAFGGFCMERM